MNPLPNWLDIHNEEVVACRLCPRLVAWREKVALEKKRAHMDEEYWGKPVPAFGDPSALHLIVGLAPAAHGANRTGQMFTGDRSGDWLFRALHRAGVANLPEAQRREDGLQLNGAIIAASCHCAPPDNKPTNDEIANCRPFMLRVLAARPWRGILCLGGIATRKALHFGRLPFEDSAGALVLVTHRVHHYRGHASLGAVLQRREVVQRRKRRGKIDVPEFEVARVMQGALGLRVDDGKLTAGNPSDARRKAERRIGLAAARWTHDADQQRHL